MSKSVIKRAREMKTMVADAQRSHAKDWLDSHGYKFQWHDGEEGLVLVQPAKHNAGVLLRPDEVLTKGELKKCQRYVKERMHEDSKKRQLRALGVVGDASR